MVQAYSPATSITPKDVEDALARYPSLVPDDLKELDRARFETIPAAVEGRLQNPDASLTKAELLQLVNWKLKHGKFRPSLLKLADSNDEASVKKATSTAFSSLQTRLKSPTPSAVVGQAMDAVQILKGIGPATASLVLSIFPGAGVPFFSDELFRFCLHRRADGKVDWQAKITYSRKEFDELCLSVMGLIADLGHEVNASKLEKAAWVWARDDGHGSGPKTNAENKPSTSTRAAENGASKQLSDQSQIATKRKAKVQEEPRRSKRHK